MKIVSKGGTLSSFEYLEKKQKATRKRRIIYSVSTFIILVALVLVSRLEKLRITEVRVEGAVVTGADPVSSAMREIISGYYLWIIPRNNTLLYPRGHAEKVLAERFPRFSSVEISLDNSRRLAVSVVEREPTALYCANSETCWFLDEQGFVFDTAPTFSEGVYFLYTMEPVVESPLGKPLLPLPEFQAVSEFVLHLNTLGIEPLTLQIGEMDLVLTSASGARLTWTRGSDTERIYNNLQSFLNSPSIEAEEDFLAKVVELDLRTEDKVFYRFNE